MTHEQKGYLPVHQDCNFAQLDPAQVNPKTGASAHLANLLTTPKWGVLVHIPEGGLFGVDLNGNPRVPSLKTPPLQRVPLSLWPENLVQV